jgi:predicted MarR family transcription regulator
LTYDLRQLRLAGLIRRLPRSNRYRLTDDGIRTATFYTKIYNRLLIPLTAAEPHPTYAPHCPQSTDMSRTT